MANVKVEQWLRDQPAEWLHRCAENEGGRAVLCLQGYGNDDTAVYFAREAARYANALLDQRAECVGYHVDGEIVRFDAADGTASTWAAIQRGDLHTVAGLTMKRGRS